MKKVGNHNSISRKLLLSLSLTLIFSLTSFAQDPAAPAAPEAAAPAATTGGDPVKGKELFNANCAACHKLDAKSTGPALRGIADKHDKAWLYKWVHNSSDMIKSGDPVAVKLFEENNKAVMTSFPQLSEGDIDNIIAFTSEKKAEPAAGAPGHLRPARHHHGPRSRRTALSSAVRAFPGGHPGRHRRADPAGQWGLPAAVRRRQTCRTGGHRAHQPDPPRRQGHGSRPPGRFRRRRAATPPAPAAAPLSPAGR